MVGIGCEKINLMGQVEIRTEPVVLRSVASCVVSYASDCIPIMLTNVSGLYVSWSAVYSP